jgi:hypothetical protein
MASFGLGSARLGARHGRAAMTKVATRLGFFGWVGAAVLAAIVLPGCPTGADEASEGARVTLHVVNNSSGDVAYLYVSPTGSERWGDDLLTNRNVIPPGSSWPVQLPPGTYDLKVEDFNHTTIQQVNGVRLTEDSEWVLYNE